MPWRLIVIVRQGGFPPPSATPWVIRSVARPSRYLPNIAEGAGRGRGSFAQFLRIAAGSASELETQLEIARDLGFIETTTSGRLLGDTRTVRNMLWGLIRKTEAASRADAGPEDHS